MCRCLSQRHRYHCTIPRVSCVHRNRLFSDISRPVSPRRGFEARACCRDRTFWRDLQSSKPSSRLSSRLDITESRQLGCVSGFIPIGGRKTLISPRVINCECLSERESSSRVLTKSRSYLGVAATGILEQRPPESSLICDCLAHEQARWCSLNMVTYRCQISRPRQASTKQAPRRI